MMYTRLFMALAIVGSLAGCAQIQKTADTINNAVSVLTEVKVSREAVVLARNAFNAAEVAATGYTNLRRCTGSNGPICRDPAVRAKLKAWVLAGRAARNDLTRFMRDHPGELGPKGLYDSLVAATATINDLIATYRANR